ncbi:MAG: hypothetical protein ABSD48_17795 [Armatimonadota bacterium]
MQLRQVEIIEGRHTAADPVEQMAAQLGAFDQIGENRGLVEDLAGEQSVFEVVVRQRQLVGRVELVDCRDLHGPTLSDQLALPEHLRGDEIQRILLEGVKRCPQHDGNVEHHSTGYPRQRRPLAKRVGGQNARSGLAPQGEWHTQRQTPPLGEGQIEVHDVPSHDDIRVLRSDMRQKRAQQCRFVGEETYRWCVGLLANHQNDICGAAACDAVDGATGNVGLDIDGENRECNGSIGTVNAGIHELNQFASTSSSALDLEASLDMAFHEKSVDRMHIGLIHPARCRSYSACCVLERGE